MLQVDAQELPRTKTTTSSLALWVVTDTEQGEDAHTVPAPALSPWVSTEIIGFFVMVVVDLMVVELVVAVVVELVVLEVVVLVVVVVVVVEVVVELVVEKVCETVTV
jgi:hypothetical protein